MQNRKFHQLSGLEQILVLQKMFDLRIAEDWMGCLTYVEDILSGDDSITRINRALWYSRAICLDMLRRPTEALVILKTLNEVFPLQHEYAASIDITIQNLARYAQEKFSEDRANPLIEHYYNTAREVNYSPWSLTEIYIDNLMASNQVDKAKMLIESYIDLSPSDYDYLKKGIEVAQKIGDTEMLSSVLEQLQAAVRLNPTDDPLAHLLILAAGAPTAEVA